MPVRGLGQGSGKRHHLPSGESVAGTSRRCTPGSYPGPQTIAPGPWSEQPGDLTVSAPLTIMLPRKGSLHPSDPYSASVSSPKRSSKPRTRARRLHLELNPGARGPGAPPSPSCRLSPWGPRQELAPLGGRSAPPKLPSEATFARQKEAGFGERVAGSPRGRAPRASPSVAAPPAAGPGAPEHCLGSVSAERARPLAGVVCRGRRPGGSCERGSAPSASGYAARAAPAAPPQSPPRPAPPASAQPARSPVPPDSARPPVRPSLRSGPGGSTSSPRLGAVCPQASPRTHPPQWGPSTLLQGRVSTLAALSSPQWMYRRDEGGAGGTQAENPDRGFQVLCSQSPDQRQADCLASL
ncbi:uncharacterized protein [Manis javanica]|uniref:uncharacterized protein n=1 Tax=Manis javanica TaxID=9974 RepID=UPI003C6D10F3